MMPGSPILAAPGRRLLSKQPMAFRPPTPLGINVEFALFWNDPSGNGGIPTLAPNQYDALRDYGVSFVRNLVSYYYVGGGVNGSRGPAIGAQFAVRPITAVAPYAADPSQLELTCDGSTYTIATGETVVLSQPLTYTDAGGATVTLPAQTPIPVMGGTTGVMSATYISTSPSTVRVAAGTTLSGSLSQAVSGTKLLHNNFYVQGTTPRGQVAAYVAAAASWLAQGFAFDHGGPGGALGIGDLIDDFGLPVVNALREQEWGYFSAQNWPADRVLISNCNEFIWGVNKYPARDRWGAGYRDYFRDFLYPRMRAYWPKHTLGFGTGSVDSLTNLNRLDWWPNDPNTLLTAHTYIDVSNATGYFPVYCDGSDPAVVSNVMDWIAANLTRLGVPQIYFQEFGLLNSASDHSARLANLRKGILSRGWLAAPWGASIGSDGYLVASRQNGVWLPVQDSLGAFGLT